MMERSLANIDKKSILEVILEKDDNASFSISDLDFAEFLKKLGLDVSTGGTVDGVQICPGGRGVIFKSLKEQEDLNKYCRYDVLDITSTGIRAVMVKPAGKREVVLTLRGVHPSTKDSVVFDYLEKFGSIVTRRVVYGVFSDGPLRGIKNGDRSYKIEMKPKSNIGSYHLIDGQRVQIKYPGQQQTCGRCFKVASNCVGNGKAKRCEAAGGQKKDFRVYIFELWNSIGYHPQVDDTGLESEVEEDGEVQQQIGGNFTPVKYTALPYEFAGVSIKQIPDSIDQGEVLEFLVDSGLPVDKMDSVNFGANGSIIVRGLENETCKELILNIHGRIWQTKKLYCNVIVPMSPCKVKV